MSTPTLKNSNLERTGPSGAEQQFAIKSQTSRPQADQVDAKDNDQQYVPDAEAVRAADARINHAAAVIRSLRDSRSRGVAPRFSPPANSNLAQDETGNRPSIARRREELEGYDFAETRPRVLSSLDPVILPDPPRFVRLAHIGPLLARFSLMAGLAAIVAYGITMFPSYQRGTFWPKAAKDSVASARPHEAASKPAQLSRLVVEDQQTSANEPLALGVSVAHALGFGSIVVGGLTPGTRLSAGTPVTAASWELPLNEVGGVYVYAPQNFVGVMNTVVDLLAPTKKIIDSRAERLEWTARADPSRRGNKIGSEGARSAVTKPIDPHDAILLMERGRDLLKSGDIALAQLAFQRLADAGMADAALALANTYDPRYLAKHNFIDMAGDETKARFWYQRASELGSPEADHIPAGTEPN